MLDRIKNILEEYVEIPKEQITLETNLMNDLDLSSLDLVNIVVEFEEEFEVEIPDRKLRELVTIGDVVRLLEKEMQD